MAELFDSISPGIPERTVPLAERMRPSNIDDYVGQEHVLGKGKFLRRLLEQKELHSLIFWGPPGTGKTTLARIIASQTGANFIQISAVTSGIKDLKKVIEETKTHQVKTILFIDEIHRWNKAQQDALLPYVEKGIITLIGATTENPSFEVISALLSRTQVIVLKSLSDGSLKNIIRRAISDKDLGYGNMDIKLPESAEEQLIGFAQGDARIALNILERAVTMVDSENSDEQVVIEPETILEASQRKSLRYDKSGEEHFNLISALHKSLRDSDPDGALYWMIRMFEAGEDPLYVARRLVRFASEDVGLADPQALSIAISATESYRFLGTPEGELALAEAAVYLATAPKSNSIYAAYKEITKSIEEEGTLPVPMHLRNAPTGLMKNLGYGKGYKYAHEDEDALVAQDHLPEELKGKEFYKPTSRGYETVIKNRIEEWKKIIKRKAANGKKS